MIGAVRTRKYFYPKEATIHFVFYHFINSFKLLIILKHQRALLDLNQRLLLEVLVFKTSALNQTRPNAPKKIILIYNKKLNIC